MTSHLTRRTLLGAAGATALLPWATSAQERRFEPQVGAWRTFETTTTISVDGATIEGSAVTLGSDVAYNHTSNAYGNYQGFGGLIQSNSTIRTNEKNAVMLNDGTHVKADNLSLHAQFNNLVGSTTATAFLQAFAGQTFDTIVTTFGGEAGLERNGTSS